MFLVLSKEFTESPASRNASVSQSLTLSCEISSIPPADILWLFNGNEALVGEVVQASQYKSTLLLEELSYAESGEFRCQAINPASGEARFSNASIINVRGESCLLIVAIRCKLMFDLQVLTHEFMSIERFFFLLG